LKWRSKSKHSFNRAGRRNFDVVARNFRDVAARRQVSKAFCHAYKGVVGVKKTVRSWIDECDSAGHVCQHFFVEHNLTLQLLLGFHLPLIEPAAEPREDR